MWCCTALKGAKWRARNGIVASLPTKSKAVEGWVNIIIVVVMRVMAVAMLEVGVQVMRFVRLL